MTAVLCRHFGLEHIEVAEDIASDTFMKASENWAIHGVPENPVAWLYTVAKNKTKDYFKHIAVFELQVKENIKASGFEIEGDFDFSSEIIADSQLSMIFTVCGTTSSAQTQICLVLQILCGFSVEEIACAFLTKNETIKKRLHRARTVLRNENFQIRPLGEADIRSGLDTVLKTLYLLFNEGHFSKTNNLLIRKDLCSEAVRLTLLLTENVLTNTPDVNALLALMCFQSSRLDARTDRNGVGILFDKQDKSLWDRSLIDRGNYHLVNACCGMEISRYHLEAAIAYWHTAAVDEIKWRHILPLYDQLLLLEYSPVTALNRAFACSKIYSCEKAIREVEKINLSESNYYHELLGYLYSGIDINLSVQHYTRAIDLTKSKTERHTLRQEIERLNTLLSSLNNNK
ncbi:RNA polymerase subunit sigma [Pedobacter sp. MC2016-24]|nr:RNA polymerase subunit sigma [Pedobacter sp. MC2016-24]